MPNDEQHRVERLLSLILFPLSKIIIKHNVTLNSAIEVLKRNLVSAALDGDDATDSRISLRTGVHRKDVKRLRITIRDGVSEKSPTKGLAMILSVWANNPDYKNSTGGPRILTRKRTPEAPGFDDLVRASKVDLAPATVLSELAYQSLIKIHDDGGIELLSTAFIAQSGEETLRAFEATMADHLAIATGNVLSPAGAPRQFDQILQYSHLSEKSVKTLDAEARRLAKEYLEHMNAMAHRLQSEDDTSGQLASGRFVAGAFIGTRYPDRTKVQQAAKKKDQEQ